MDYFSDLKFINAGDLDGCVTGIVDKRYPHKYSLQFNQSGRVSYGVNHNRAVILEGPVVYLFLTENSYQYGAADGVGYHHSFVNFAGPRAERIIRDGFLRLAPEGFARVLDPDRFTAKFAELLDLVQRTGSAVIPMGVVLLDELLLIMRESRMSNAGSGAFGGRMNDLADRLRNDPFRNWNFRELAGKRFSSSYSHFRRRFKEVLGQAPYDYLLRVRMEVAASKLRNAGISVKQLAFECGFDDPVVFSRMFKSRMGLSPKHYRESLGG
ncbi:MAG: helix-turn-helix transcriptional regulator [Kiritimatiellaeota bacterium]|nr:helix-turn-helix transcriptional regulator [Kiritimatiellota bacterium]